ncbi:MAG: F0F1 ATP synthase subunit gamma [Alphaproteobacteria bacterium]|nr:F0F1 ATP synthase subunit gamma [Alphaproteobacteria bacterium]
MPSLKDLKLRINSVKSTQKITSAMKMVSAAKLRRAQEQAEASRPYAARMQQLMMQLTKQSGQFDDVPSLLQGREQQNCYLLIPITSDRGLCGSFNTAIVRSTRRLIKDLLAKGKTVKIMPLGRKGRDLLRREYASLIVDAPEAITKTPISFSLIEGLVRQILHQYEAQEFDVCTVIYNRFKSVISQVVTQQDLIPVVTDQHNEVQDQNKDNSGGLEAIYEYEPEPELLLAELLPRNLAVQIYGALLESAAGEQGARMAAMDNATRNAGDMINRLTVFYNRSRQAYITKELIEIISGAEAI